jgi:ribosomal protein S18 acetylase RimI-like enzyme
VNTGKKRLRIRKLRSDDYERLVELWQASNLPYRPRGRDRRECIDREIEGPCSAFLAAELDGKIVGAVLGTHDGRKGWVNRLVVAPEAQRQGVGAALVEELASQFEERGIGITACLIEDWNADSMAFFEAIGFVPNPDCLYYTRRTHRHI